MSDSKDKTEDLDKEIIDFMSNNLHVDHFDITDQKIIKQERRREKSWKKHNKKRRKRFNKKW